LIFEFNNTEVGIIKMDYTQKNDVFFINLFEKQSALMVLIDPESGLIIDANSASVEFYGYPKSVLCKMTINDINQFNTEQFNKDFQKSLNYDPINSIFKHKLSNGEIRFVEVHSSPIIYLNKKILFSIIHDVTEKFSASQALKECEEKYRILFENIGEGFGFVDEEEQFVIVNSTAEKLFGVSAGELVGKNLSEFMSEDTFKFIKSQNEERRKGITSTFEHEIIQLRGDKKHLLVTSVPKIGNDGKYFGTTAIFRDITMRKKSEETLQKSEERFRQAFEYSAIGMCLVGMDGKIQRFNNVFKDMLGFSEDELINLTFNDFTHPDDKEIDSLSLNKLLKGDIKNFTFEKRYIKKDGNIIWVSVSPSIIKNNEKESFIITHIIDISNRKLIEEDLLASEKRFKNAFQYSPIGMALVSTSGNWIKVNSRVCSILGYSENELLTKTFQDFTHPDDLDLDLKYMLQMLKGKIETYTMEKRYFHKNGSTVWVLLAVTLVKDKEGIPLYFISQLEDISNRKKAEEELKSSMSLLNATLESTADGILVIDKKWKIVLYNQKFLELWSITKDLIIQNDDVKTLKYIVDQLIFPEKFLVKIRELDNKSEESNIDILNLKCGKVFKRYSHPQRIGDEIVGHVWSFRDITKRVRSEAEIQMKNIELEELNISKDKFFSIIAHDLRSPFSGFLGLTKLMSENISNFSL
jgi:hypothetical protein